MVTLYKVAGLFMIKPFMSNIFSAVLRSVPPGWWVVICACCMVPHGDDVKHFHVKKEEAETKETKEPFSENNLVWKNSKRG